LLKEAADLEKVLFIKSGLQPGQMLLRLVAQIIFETLPAFFGFLEGASLSLLVVEEQIPLFKKAAYQPNLLADYRAFEQQLELFSVLRRQVIGSAQHEVAAIPEEVTHFSYLLPAVPGRGHLRCGGGGPGGVIPFGLLLAEDLCRDPL
jgi:hypothetical protein